jgi:acyl-CoA dehydrogenase
VDFALTHEQRALRESARAFLAARGYLEDVGTHRTPDAEWAELTALGWLDPDLGGVELAVLAEESGYALGPPRWLVTVGLAAPAYRYTGRVPAGPATLAWADAGPAPAGQRPAVARQVRATADAARLGSAACTRCRVDDDGPDGVRLTGVKRLVAEAGTMAHAVVVARDEGGVGLFHVDLASAPGLVHTLSTVDTGRPLAELRFVATPARRLVPPDRAEAVLSAIRVRAHTLLAAEALGVARRALDLAIGHARTRTQFGRPIGAYQAVAHRLADACAAGELARSLVYRAAWTTTCGQDQAAPAALAALIAAKETATLTCEVAIQTLGGIGFTWEHPLRRLYRRAQWISAFDGHPSAHRADLARLLAEGAAGAGAPPVNPAARASATP